jgi:hypothetical protein
VTPFYSAIEGIRKSDLHCARGFAEGETEFDPEALGAQLLGHTIDIVSASL